MTRREMPFKGLCLLLEELAALREILNSLEV